MGGINKEVGINNRIGKTRDLFKKIRDTKGTFQAKMGSIKDRNGMDLTEAEDIKKRWQEYIEELYKKDLHDLDNHDGVITHLEPDMRSQVGLRKHYHKASGGDGIPVELVKSLSCVRLFATPWTVAHQASPSMGFSRQEYWSGLPFPSPEDLPDPGIESGSPTL